MARVTAIHYHPDQASKQTTLNLPLRQLSQ